MGVGDQTGVTGSTLPILMILPTVEGVEGFLVFFAALRKGLGNCILLPRFYFLNLIDYLAIA